MRKRFFFVLYMLMMLLLTEAAFRVYIAARYKVSFFKPYDIMLLYYPELRPVLENNISLSDGYTDILLMGGSVLNPKYGHVEEELIKQLNNPHVRIHNVARSAHTSLDSRIKYELLAGKHFDLVFVYHAINEIRANNCPDEVFREDYSHYSWYLEVDELIQHKEMNITVIPYMLHHLYKRILFHIQKPVLLPTHLPPAEWLDYGKKVKTAVSFEKNMEYIVKTTGERGDRLLLSTFSVLKPENTPETGGKLKVVELWGKQEYVLNAINVHNNITRKLAEKYKSCSFIDMEKIFPNEVGNFYDICHLSPKGSAEFAKILIPYIKK